MEAGGKQTMQKIIMKRLNLKKVNKMEGNSY
jgi:hypothetical protein